MNGTKIRSEESHVSPLTWGSNQFDDFFVLRIRVYEYIPEIQILNASQSDVPYFPVQLSMVSHNVTKKNFRDLLVFLYLRRTSCFILLPTSLSAACSMPLYSNEFFLGAQVSTP